MPTPRSNFTKHTSRLYNSRVVVTRVVSNLGRGTVETVYDGLPCLIQPLTGQALTTALGIASEARYGLYCGAEFASKAVDIHAGDIITDQTGKAYSVPTPSFPAGGGHHVEVLLGDKL